MPNLKEKVVRVETEIVCQNCKKSVSVSHYWEVNQEVICERCFAAQYSDMIKCVIDNCEEYEEPANFTDGMCESCLEVNTPPDQENQAGWEDNIRKWNDEGP